MGFHIIVATDQNHGIGQGGHMPWHIPKEIHHFSELTKKTSDPNRQNAVIMGRTTWESLPEKYRPLPERYNIVLTRNSDFHLPANVERARSLNDALALTAQANIENTFVIGGSQVFAEAMEHPELESIYLTEVHVKVAADSYFPIIDQEKFSRIEESSLIENAGFTFQYIRYQKKPWH